MKSQTFDKVLIYLIPCFLFWGCLQKQYTIRIPSVKLSNFQITKIAFDLDTVEKFQPIARNSIVTTDSRGNARAFCIFDGLEVTLDYAKNENKWKVVREYTPFNEGKSKSNIVHSELVYDSIVYFLHDEVLWEFNVSNYSFTKLNHFGSNIRTKNGTLYHNWQDCYNQTPGIVFCKFNNTLYFPIFSYGKDENKYFIGSYELTNQKTNVIYLERPHVDEMIQRSVQDNTMFIVGSNKIYFAFGFSKLGLVYDLFDHHVDTLNLQSMSDTIPQKTYTEKNTGIKSSSERLIKTIIYNARYEYFTYNPFKKHYYKIFNKYLEEDNKLNGLKNTLNEKEVVLQIYDSCLNLIKEVPLPKNIHYVSMILINRHGLSIFEPTDVDFIKSNPNKIQMLNISYE